MARGARSPEGAPLRLLVLNPNSTRAMTDTVAQEVARRAGPGIQVTGATAVGGPPVIATRATFAEGARAGLEAIRAHAEGFDAVILACFGDPGIAAIRAACAIPVVGLAQASFERASRVGDPWAIVTAGAEWAPMLREIVVESGAARDFLDVVTIAGSGLDAVRDAARFRSDTQRAVDAAQALGAGSIILGGAAFAGLARGLSPVARLLDCIECATDAALSAVGAARR